MSGKLRHIALSVPNPSKAAKFYEESFGFERVHAHETTGADVVYLSDGVMSLTLLEYKNDKVAGKDTNPYGFGKDFVGLHHLGFWVDEVDETKEKIEDRGATYLTGEPTKGRGFYEVKYRDPNGILFDITHNGWAGSVKNVKPASD